MKQVKLWVVGIACSVAAVSYNLSFLLTAEASDRRTITTRVVPADLFSSDTSPSKRPAPSDTVNLPRPIHSRTIDCLTTAPSEQQLPIPLPENPLPIEWTIIEDGDVVHVIPNYPLDPIDGLDSREPATLDEGSDACPATVITALPYVDQGTMHGTHNDYLTSCRLDRTLPDRIYQYTAMQSAMHALELTGNYYYWSLGVRTEGACPGSVEIACASNNNSNTHRLLLNLTAGTTYYFVVESDTSDEEPSDYIFRVSAASACQPDFELTAPGAVSGMTCFAHDDCPLMRGDDQLVELTIPHDGYWRIALCDAAEWDAKLILTRACCDSIITSSTYGCPYSITYYSRPMIDYYFLSAGVYFVHVEGRYWRACGAWALTVEEILPCTGRPSNDDCEAAGPPAALPATFIGDNTCATRDCELLTRGQGETWHAFSIDATSDVFIDYCESETYSYSMYRVLVSGCLCQSLIQATETVYNACVGSGHVAFVFRDVAPGIYYYPVLRDSTYGVEGPYTVHVRSMPTCQVENQPGDIIECLDTPALSAIGIDCDRGCGSTEFFQPIEIGQTVFGRSFTYLDQYNYRRTESDWFEFTLDDTSSLTVTATAEFPIQFGIYDRECAYQSDYILTSVVFPCSTVTITSDCLRPNRYALGVRPSGFMAPTDTMHYRVTLSSELCDWPCDISQEAGDQPEGEPLCADNYQDTYNSGCNGYPEVFQDIACGDTILGTSGVFRRGSGIERDMDWFRVTITERSIITLSVIAEFDVYLILSDYCPGCDGGLSESFGPMCELVQTRALCLPPGSYILAVFPQDWSYLPCGTEYRMWVTCEPCTPCNELLQAGDILEAEPPCSTYSDYVDQYNGGCNSELPAFGPEITCGQTILGTTGTWWSSGMQRDTDWLQFNLNGASTTHFCVVAQFPVMTAILGPGGTFSCDSIMLYSDIGFGNPCDTVCVTSFSELISGSYWLYVSPGVFENILCGSEYRAWVSCDGCQPDTVNDVTIRRVDDDIYLRWTTDPSFTGTYTVYSTASVISAFGENWTSVASGITPEHETNRAVYIHHDAFQTTGHQYYIVVGVCP